MAYLYRHIRTDLNQPFYIGVGEDIPEKEGSFKRAYEKTNRNSYWCNIVNKTKYIVEIILDDISWKEACEKETEFILLYGRSDMNQGPLCNLTNGGEGKKGVLDTLETRIKKSNSAKKPKTEQWKISQSLSRKGKPRGILPWLINNPERSEKIRQSKLNKPSLKKSPVLQFDKNMNLIQEFPSITEASLYINIPYTAAICECCQGKRKSAYGFIWKYKNI
jgi:hypothetical protein